MDAHLDKLKVVQSEFRRAVTSGGNVEFVTQTLLLEGGRIFGHFHVLPKILIDIFDCLDLQSDGGIGKKFN